MRVIDQEISNFSNQRLWKKHQIHISLSFENIIYFHSIHLVPIYILLR